MIMSGHHKQYKCQKETVSCQIVRVGQEEDSK